MIMKTKTIKQTIDFKLPPSEIYGLLMDSEKHSAITGSEAEISNEVGGKIWAYDGYITGENIELVPDKKIVQKWRGSDWPEGHFSKATFKLDKTKEGTKLTFTQTSVPEEVFEDVAQGWYEFYWDPMKEMFDQG
jgi:activator of HSP90 ATPase